MTTKTELGSLPQGLLDEKGSDRLHIGGTTAKRGWKILNALPGDHVDFCGDMRDLSRFSDASFDMVYASHVLEHVGYQKELPEVLSAIARITRPGGRFFASVPDLEVLCRLFLHPQMDPPGRFAIMRMMFGGQMDEFDFHQVGLNDEMLASMLMIAGFREVFRVPTFGIFDDTSTLRVGGVLISLNLVAVR